MFLDSELSQRIIMVSSGISLFWPEVLAIIGLKVFENEREAFVGGYLIKSLPHLKKVSIDQVPKWIKRVIFWMTMYSLLYACSPISSMISSSNLNRETKLLLVSPLAIVLGIFLLSQLCILAAATRKAMIWTALNAPEIATYRAGQLSLAVIKVTYSVAASARRHARRVF